MKAGSGVKADMQQQLAACLENASVIAVLKNKNKELGKMRLLGAAEKAHYSLQTDKMKLEVDNEHKDNVISRLKWELATFRRKVVSYANTTLGM